MSQIHVLDGKTDFMLAVLSNSSENTIFYDDNHLQQLSDSKETFDFTTVPESDATPYLRERNRLVIPVEGNIFREFIIDETIQDFHKVEVYSTASHLELKKGKPLPPGKHEGQSLNTMMDIVLAGTGWKRGNTDYSGTATIEFDKYVSPFQALQETAFAHDMELSFRIETNGNKVTGRYVDAVKRIGGFLGRELNSMKDLVNATRRETTEDVVTALVGIGPEKENGDRVVVEVTNEEARQVWGRDGRHLWEVLEVQSDNQDMTEAQVRQYTKQSLDARIAAAIEYTIDGADLEYVLGLENEKIRLGDSVRIKATEYEPPLYLDARVIAIESSISDPTEKTFTLGEFIEYEERDIRALREHFQYLLAQKTNLFFSDEPPVNTHWIWIDTSGGKNVMKTYNYDTGEWEASEGEQGPPGPPGVSSYTHIAYANSSDGLTDFSVSDSKGRAYLGIYVDSNPVDSQNPFDYNWTLIKGAKGDEGIAGKTGADGRTPYFHTAWADSPDGRVNFSVSEAGTRAYLGTYTDYTQADSTDPSKYSWAKIQGPEGEKGEQGEPGQRGEQGVPGPKGENGQTLYTWVKYADTATGGGISDSPTGKSYIGLAYNKTTPNESAQASDYTWSLLKGDQGAEGPKGKDGQTLYTWVKYADNPLGGGMSDDPTGKAYMGIAYNKTSQTESTDASQYTWSLIKGQDGADGKDGQDGADGKDGAPGIPGKDGATTYTWIKYADNAVGGGMSDSPTGKKYMGVAHNKTSPTESNNAADYAWSLIQGPQGPNRVDSTTEIAANVINSNHINVGQLSALSSDLGYVNAGTLHAVTLTGAYITGGAITSNTTINVGTDAYVGQNLYLQYEYSNRFNEKGVIFYDGASHGGRPVKLSGTYLKLDITAPNVNFMGTVNFEDSNYVNFGRNSDVWFNGYQPTTSSSEQGFCGVGAMEPTGTRNAIAGVGVNFKMKKSYTPSSVGLTSTSNTATAFTANITNQGFWLYVEGSNTAYTYRYWRGYYNA